MERSDATSERQCPSAEFGSYIDGELGPHEELELEMHVAKCAACSDELNLQKTFLSQLDRELDDGPDIELPEDFTKVVVANAESRVNGLRQGPERFRAALICLALLIFVLFASGADGSRAASAFGALIEKTAAVATFAAHFAYDLAIGTVIILRGLSTHFASDTATLLVPSLLIISLLVFSRLILKLDRT